MFHQFRFPNFFALLLTIASVIGTVECSFAQKSVEILNSDLLEMKETSEGKMKTLSGNVVLKQDDVLLYCDNADFTDWDNSVFAKGAVKVKQGDSITLYCNELTYFGNTKKLIASKNVRLEKGKSTLLTNKLDYDLNTKTGWYSNGGKLINDSTLLLSESGNYFASSGDAYFYRNVKVTNPTYTLNADTFRFNMEQKVNYFLGPTHITVDTNKIYCESGSYNLKNGAGLFIKHATFENRSQFITGDTIGINKSDGTGFVNGKGTLTDKVQHIDLMARHIRLQNATEQLLAYDDAWLKLQADRDSIYIHADTLFTNRIQTVRTLTDSLQKQNYQDTVENRFLRAWHKVILYNHSFQAVCDSATYFTADSVFRLFTQPLLWIDSSQLSADTIYIFQQHKAIHHLKLIQHAFIASHVQAYLYNQLSGKIITGYLSQNKLQAIQVNGTAKSIYFSEDEGHAFAGINKIASSNMKLLFEDGAVSQIRFYGQPEAAFSPLKHYPKADMYFKEFNWQAAKRPTLPALK